MPAVIALAQATLGITRRQLGERIGRDPSNLGARMPKFDVAARLAGALGWPVTTLAMAIGLESGAGGDRSTVHETSDCRGAVVLATVAILDGRERDAIRLARRYRSARGAGPAMLAVARAIALERLDRRDAAHGVISEAMAIRSARPSRADRALDRLRERMRVEALLLRGGCAAHVPARRVVATDIGVRPRCRHGAVKVSSHAAATAGLIRIIDDRAQWIAWLGTVASRRDPIHRLSAALTQCMQAHRAWRCAHDDVCAGDRRAVPDVAGAAATIACHAILVGAQRQGGSVDPTIVRELSHSIGELLDASVVPGAGLSWRDRRLIVDAEIRRRTLVALITGMRTPWPLTMEQVVLVVGLVARFPRFRRRGLRLLAGLASAAKVDPAWGSG